MWASEGRASVVKRRHGIGNITKAWSCWLLTCSYFITFRVLERVCVRNSVSTSHSLFALWSEVILGVHFLRLHLAPRLTLNISSPARQRCLSSWGPLRTPWLFCNFSTVWCGRLLKLCFLGFWNYNSVIQALLASNIFCLFISTEVSQ